MIFYLPGRKGLGDLWRFLRLEGHQGHIPGSQAILDIFLSPDLQLLTIAGWENRDKDSQSDIADENEILIPQMPKMDGFEATASIRDKEKRTGFHIPNIAMTAHALKGDRERCLDAGMDDYIAKPLRAEGLIKKIDFVVSKMKKRQEKLPVKSRTMEKNG